MKPDLAIIIISFNTKDITKRCLDTIFTSLIDAPFTTEVLVLDNASTDGSREILRHTKSHSKNVHYKLIESKENLGFGKGNNRAVEKTTSDTLLFLNSDTEVIDAGISTLYEYFISRDNEFDIVGAKLIEKDRTTPQPSCGPSYSLWNIFLFLFLRGDYLHITRYSPTTIKSVDWVSGACFMMHRKDFLSLGGFDEGIFMYMEEIDLFHRAKLQKNTIGFYPDARFIHLGSASSQKRTQPILQVYKGYLYFYRKYFSTLDIFILKLLLQLKAIIALTIGKVRGDRYLIETYEKALEITTMA